MHQTNALHYLLYRTTHLHLERKYRGTLVVGFACIVTAFILAQAALFLLPKQQMFSYAGSNCVSRTTFLPRLHKIQASPALNAQFSELKQIGGYPLIANSICASLAQPVEENTRQSITVSPLGNPLIKQVSNFQIQEFPAATSEATKTLAGTISTKETLTLQLDKADDTFSYTLGADTKSAPCIKQRAELRCDVAKLELAQAKTYELSLQRSFGGHQMDTLLKNSVQTVTPITVTATSVANNATVYDAPKSITVSFDKPLASYEGITLKKADGTALPFESSHQDKTLTITFKENLPRSAQINLVLSDVKATDKGFLQDAYTLAFTTSGGPKVTGKNIGSYDIAPNSAIRLTFDVALASSAASFFELKANGAVLGASVVVSGNTATITPSRSFNKCEGFTVTVRDGLQNTYGISGGSGYSFSSRSTCRTVFSIGTSVEGRAITAYKFGAGPSTVLYVGGTHGNETSSKSILDSWVSHLESVAPTIPTRRSIIVIPSINPDGVARNNRNNARNVDLNRNFPANSWKADVTIPGGQLVVNGGGTSALSEPESAALASYTLSLRPRLVLTYHAKGSIVTANESGDSLSLAGIYGRSTRYWVLAESQLGNTFNYDTTGAYENWLHDKVGIPALLIELPNHTSNYFTSNRDAMWHMANL